MNTLLRFLTSPIGCWPLLGWNHKAGSPHLVRERFSKVINGKTIQQPGSRCSICMKEFPCGIDFGIEQYQPSRGSARVLTGEEHEIAYTLKQLENEKHDDEIPHFI